jgi:hypothetical protein
MYTSPRRKVKRRAASAAILIVEGITRNPPTASPEFDAPARQISTVFFVKLILHFSDPDFEMSIGSARFR